MSRVAYLLLASVYLLYLPHAEFLLDDWLVLGRYQQAREAGRESTFEVAGMILQNRFHNQFRFQALSFSIGYVMFLLAGYSPAVMFASSVLLHAGCALALRRLAEKLELGSRTAFLSGAVFLLLPTTHGPLFWSHNCSFFLWSTLWFLLYLGSLAAGKGILQQSAFLLLALFSGDPIFGLLLAGAPITAWFLRVKGGVRATLLAWGTVLIAATFYALLVNRAPMFTQGVGLRYQFSGANLVNNLQAIFDTYIRVTGLTPGSFYQLRATVPAMAAAAGAALITVLYIRRMPPDSEQRRVSTGRIYLLAGALWVAAFGPVLFLRGHEFRYDYVPTPYLALAIAVSVLAVPAARLALTGLLAGYLAVVTVADIDQSWVPQSRIQRVIGKRLRELGPLKKGDVIIVSQTPLWIGTAPDFSFQSGMFSDWFAEYVTGARGLETGRNIVVDNGKLRIHHSDSIRDMQPQELAHTHVLVLEHDRLTARRLLAFEARPGAYRLYPLKGYGGPSIGDETFTREQLAMVEGEMYLARPFSHQPHAH